MHLVRTGSLLKFKNPSQYRTIVHKTWKSIHIFHLNSKRKNLLLQLNFTKFCYNRQSPNKHSKFHTSPRRHFDPTVWPIIRNVLKGTGIISGRGFRQWWQALPDKKRRYFFHSARKKRHELLLLITLLGCCFYVYHWKHLQVAPVSGRERFIAFTDYQFDKIMEFQAQKLCAELKGKFLPANHLYYGVVLNTLNVLINANQDISQVKDIKWTVAIVEDPAVNAVVLPTGHIFVNRGLIEFVHDVDQLAFVLAHEMSHAILKHTAENLSRLQLVDYLGISTMTTLWALMPNDGIAIVFHWFLNKVVNVLLDLPYSRFLENEADKVGLELAAKKIGLQFKADLENITNLKPDGEDFRWYLRLKCISCGEETHEFQYLTLTENSPLKGGRGHASLVIKCKLCSRENSIDILKDTIKPYTADDSGHLKTMVVFDCRGVEPIEFSPRVGFVAEGAESGTNFPEVELTEGEWCDYDEKASVPVGVSELGHKFITVK